MKTNIRGNRYFAIASDGAVNWDHRLNRGLVGWWLAHSSSGGGRWRDLCGKNHGTLANGASWTGNVRGRGGVIFDGVNDSVNLGTAASLNLTDFSLSAWIFPTAWPAIGYGRVFNRNESAAGYGVYTNDSEISAGITLQVGTSLNSPANALTLGVWQHVACTMTGTTGTIYVNGVLSATATLTAATTDAGPAFIGNRSAGDRSFLGTLDDVRIWNRGLTAVEVLRHYRVSRIGYRVPDGPLRWMNTRTWFTAASTVIYYVSPTGSDAAAGTATGTPWLTVAKVNASSFVAGDQILFKRGGRWREQLTVPSSGSSGSPITIGAYDSGANPIIDGSEVAGSWVQAENITDNGATYTASGSDEDSGLGVTRNMRWVVPAASITTTASEITVTFRGAVGAGGTIVAASIGERSGSTDDFTGTPTRLTFSGGANGIAIGADAEVTTDAITFALDETKDYLVAVWTTNRSILYKTGGASTQMYFKADGVDESQTTTATGYDASFTGYTGVRRINSVSTTPISNVYQAPNIASSPGVVYRNGVRQSIAADVASLNSTNTWVYASGLYVYSAADPAGDGSTWEAPQRTYAGTTNAKDYLNFDNLDFRMGKTFGLETTGSDTVNTLDCNFYQNASSGVSIEQASATVTITGGSVHDNGGVAGGDSNGIGTGGLGAASTPIVIDGVAIYDNVNDAIEVFGPPTGGTTTITIKNCNIYGTLSTGTGGGIRFSGDGTIVSLLNDNTIYRTRDHGIIASMATGGVLTVELYHNTITLNRSAGLYAAHGTWTVKDTIFAQNDQAVLGWPEVVLEPTVTSYTGNYNLVYHSAGGTFMQWLNGTSYNWANWKTASGQDANSVNATPLFASDIGNDYRLQIGSLGIDAGVAIAGINDGYVGAAPNIGSFETTVGASGFKVAWARGSNQTIGMGV